MTKRAIYAVCAAVLLLAMATGCARPLAKVGPNPAAITVIIEAEASQPTLDAALARPMGWSSFDAWDRGWTGPFWTLQAWLIDEQGKRFRLPRVDQDQPLLKGLKLSASRTMLVPPGKQRLRMELVCSIDRHWEQWVERYERVPTTNGYRYYRVRDSFPRTTIVTLAYWERELEVDLEPGQKQTLRPFDQPPTQGAKPAEPDKQ